MIVKRGTKASQYQSSCVNGEVKTVSQGTVSTQELQEHEQRKEVTQQQRRRDEDPHQLQQAIHPALPFAGMMCAHGFSDDTELLTKDGWRGIDEVEVGDAIATLNKDSGAIEYQPALNKFEEDYVGPMYHMKSHAADHLVTPNHVMLYESYGTWKEKTAEEFFITGAKIPVSGIRQQSDLNLYDSDDELRFHVWAVTDGHLALTRKTDGRLNYRFRFTRERKIKRLLALLDRLGFAYNVSTHKDKITTMSVLGVHTKFTKILTDEHRKLSPRQATALLIEWSHTDGSYASSRTEDHFQLSTNVSFHRNLLQELAAVSGHKSICAINKKDGHPDVYMVRIGLNVFRVKSDVINRGTVDYAGRIWCLETANHTLIARRNGKVFISSN